MSALISCTHDNDESTVISWLSFSNSPMAEEFLPLENSSDKDSSENIEPQPQRKRIKHLLIGDPTLVRSTIHSLHVLGYAEVREWSKLQTAGVLGDPGEVVSVLLRYTLPD